MDHSTFRAEFPRDSTVARADLQGLVDSGLAVAEGERRGRTYSLAPVLLGQSVPRQNDLFTDEEKHDDAVQDSPQMRPTRREINAEVVRAALQREPLSTAALVETTGLSRRRVAYALDLLRERGEVVLDGRRGNRSSIYRRTDD